MFAEMIPRIKLYDEFTAITIERMNELKEWLMDHCKDQLDKDIDVRFKYEQLFKQYELNVQIYKRSKTISKYLKLGGIIL